ncbi:MAG: tRNA (adenosine(37)-N6)-threonylcarbamoyltransferase complex transferase subunit TsaD [Nitrospirae bacterium]|nr:tRNA (adenosine(37)-N6)-threonylcarbamoyltransferase complex transferase subunit TsaD [Nitrospirota bacterium]MBI3352546.1 tRNA (adenosine(37)-N6)-threonylcarbamoyltransferase complex transferase subunit TsaD [Nitrospirota bacterium]
MNILAIETSCDETGVSVLKDGHLILANLLSTQVATHAPFGGIVPELASRKHMEMIQPMVLEAIRQAGLPFSELDAVAVTYGPGLVGALVVGVSFGKALSYALNIPLIGIHHLEGHIHSIFLENPGLPYPFIALVVSGGHTNLYRVEGSGSYFSLGHSIDDAAGEALDKAGKMLNLGYPGGPVIDELAKRQDPDQFIFPRAFLSKNSYDFSFSGLKTSLRTFLEKKTEDEIKGMLPQIAAGFQQAIVDVLVKKTLRAALEFKIPNIVIVGGVAANSRLRAEMSEEGKREGIQVHIPSPRFCTDNAAMIARAALDHFEKKHFASLDLNPVGSLTLEEANG